MQMTHKILLVADDLIFAQQFSQQLENLGYQVVGHARTGEQSAHLSDQLAPDLVILDMEPGPALESSPAANPLRPFGDIPLIYLVSRVDKQVLDHARLAGVAGLLVKPVDTRQLQASIDVALYRSALEEKLRGNEERFSLVTQATSDGVWDWDLKTGEFYFSPHWKAMLGFREDDIGNHPDEWFKRVHPDDQKQLQVDFVAHIKGFTSRFEREYRMQHADGSIVWMLARGVAVRDADGVAYRMAGSQTDITARKLAEERQAYDTLHDTLTGLPNRVLFMDRLEFRLERTRRHTNNPFAVLFLDLDRFKVVNDTLGHAVGDQLLITTAVRIQQCLRPEDTVSRLSGDEFAVLINEVHDIQDAVRIAERIRSRLVTTTLLGAVERSPSASIGIVLCDNDYDNAEDLLRDADLAMYRAKTLGRNRHQIFDAAMFTGAVALLQLEVELKRAVARQEWQVLYQPIVSLESGKTIGVEALLRWLHPQRGVVYPLEFIRVAEDTGYIVKIGEYVLRVACQQVKAWRDAGRDGLWVAVNISARQFQDERLVEMVRQILTETGLPSDGLRLEVTESVAMHDLEYSIRILNELNKLGVYASLDDFGTGYSSLSYLKRFPLKVLKIDQSFIQDIRVNRNSEAITEAIIAMARSLNLEVVAEGVEKEDQLEFLRTLVCDHVQGFYLSLPLPAQELSAIFDDHGALPGLRPE
jgi:diguanylate cyclase (GGDEF)-like protein/PAS domain S-box-containing protein